MKKSFIILLILLVGVLVGWYAVNNWYQNKKVNQSAVENQEATSSASSVDQNNSISVVKETEDKTKILAYQIIDKLTVFGVQVSADEKRLYSEKIEEAINIIKSNYDYLNPWLDLGSYRKLAGDYDGAIEAWNFAGIIRPQNSISFHNLGDLYGFYLKNYPKAEENFLKSISNNPENIDAYIQLVTLYEYQYKEKINEIEPLLLKGIEANPSSSNLKITLGEFYKNRNRINEAIKYFEEALKLSPSNKALEREIADLKANS